MQKLKKQKGLKNHINIQKKTNINYYTNYPIIIIIYSIS